MIPGGASHTTLDKISYLQQLADDPAQPAELRQYVAGELERQKAWSRVRFYSTEKAANDYLTQRYADRARQFESRDATRNRLVGQIASAPRASGLGGERP